MFLNIIRKNTSSGPHSRGRKAPGTHSTNSPCCW